MPHFPDFKKPSTAFYQETSTLVNLGRKRQWTLCATCYFWTLTFDSLGFNTATLPSVFYTGCSKSFPPYRADESRKASVKLTITPSNTFNLKRETQILAPETFSL